MKTLKIVHPAIAGTLESSDIQIMLDINDQPGIEINLKSSVINQYGRHIRTAILETLNKLGIEQVKLTAVDNGALDCTIAARVIAAVHRAADVESDYDWKGMDQWNA